MNEKKTGTNVPKQPTTPPIPPRGGSSAHRPAQTVKIGVETEGLDEATAKIETLADALDGFPAQVTIKGAKNCAFNIYPSQVLSKTTQVTKDPEDQDGEAQDID